MAAMPTATLLTLLLALASHAGDGVLAREAPPRRAPLPCDQLDWLALPLDEVIGRLPDVDQEWRREPEVERLALHPAVQELRRRLDGGLVLSNEQWCDALIGSGVIRWRSTWPVGSPFAISLRLPRWVDTPRLRVLPRHMALSEASCGWVIPSCGFAHALEWERALHIELGFLPLGRHELVFDVAIEDHEWEGGERTEKLFWQGEFPLEVEVVAGLDIVLPARSDPLLVEALRDLVLARRSSKSDREAWLFLGKDLRSRQALAGVALSIEVELLHRQRVVETYPPASFERGRRMAGGSALPPEHHTLSWLKHIPAPDEDLTGWTLRLRGVDQGALRWWNATTRFTGELEIPLADLLREDE